MTRQEYSSRESLNRILRLLQGKAVPTDAPDTISGVFLSENAALSDIAELLAGSLPNESAELPSNVSVDLSSLVEYGMIYNNSTGTAQVALSTSWAKVTGSFQGNGVSSSNIVPDYANDKITINKVGTYFVGIQASFSGGANAVIEGSIYLGGLRQESIRFRRKLSAIGDVGSASALGIISVTGTAVDVEFYARTDLGTPAFKLESGQIWLYGLT